MLITTEEHKTIIDNFLNMVIMETMGFGGDCAKLSKLRNGYFEEE
jgi:hypothetical protein